MYFMVHNFIHELVITDVIYGNIHLITMHATKDYEYAFNLLLFYFILLLLLFLGLSLYNITVNSLQMSALNSKDQTDTKI